MRVLLATDGSPSARIAVELVRALRWEAGTALRVLDVLPPLPSTAALGLPAVRASLEAISRDQLHEVAVVLERDGLAIEESIVRSEAVAHVIVAEASEWKADVVVTGSRGHGAIASMLLGSVAAAVTDSAPCPVLVARRPTCARIVFAEDGSDSAREARRLVTRWPIFKGAQVSVVSVAQVTRPLRSGIAPTMLDEARQAEAEALAEARSAHERLARQSSDDLQRAGRSSQPEVREGDVAAEILAAAERSGADLIVMGSRGRSGVTRAVLGSVARNVLLHAPCSVLIARHGAGGVDPSRVEVSRARKP